MHGKKVILGTYNHMPEGASNRMFELTYQSSLRPFLSSLCKFPNVYAMLYYSGTVLQWIEENHPEFLILLEEMVNRRQLEMLGGGFFSPMLSALQPSDRLGQIEMLTTYLRKALGKRPSGGWLYEYGWDSTFPHVLRSSGFSYTFLPANKLVSAGLAQEDLGSPILTEDQRKMIYVFPVFDTGEILSSAMPFESALEKIEAIYPECGLYTIMADGHSIPAMWEASGLESPDVMFERTFAWFQKNCLDIETTTAQAQAKTFRSSTLFYLSSCASSRVTEAFLAQNRAMPSSALPHISRQLILGNPAARLLSDKMQHVRGLVNLLRGDKSRKKSAQEDLWRTQSGDAYWESFLGGIRRPEVRIGLYRNLLEAEKATRIHGSFSPGVLLDDIDCDGEREILYQAADYNCYVHSKGALAFELDSMKSRHNYCSSYDVSRKGRTGLFRDAIHPAHSFVDPLLDLSAMSYSVSDKERGIQNIIFWRDAHFRQGTVLNSLSIRKSYLFQKHCASVDYHLENQSQRKVEIRFCTELWLQPAASREDAVFSIAQGRSRRDIPAGAESFDSEGDAVFVECLPLKEILEIRSDCRFAALVRHRMDGYKNEDLVRLQDRGFASAIQGFPEGELFYQGTSILLGWDLVLPPDSFRNISVSLHL